MSTPEKSTDPKEMDFNALVKAIKYHLFGAPTTMLNKSQLNQMQRVRSSGAFEVCQYACKFFYLQALHFWLGEVLIANISLSVVILATESLQNE